MKFKIKGQEEPKDKELELEFSLEIEDPACSMGEGSELTLMINNEALLSIIEREGKLVLHRWSDTKDKDSPISFTGSLITLDNTDG